MILNYFEKETIFVNENVEKNPFVKFTTNNNNVYLFQNMNNSIIYYNDNSHSIRNLVPYKNLMLINFCIFDYKEFIGLIYSNGDILFISENYILNENFESFWETVSNSNYDLNEYLNNSNEKNKKNNLFSDLLACGEINLFNKKNFYFINIFKNFHFFDDNNEELDERIITFSSLQIWNNKINEFLLFTYENYIFFISFGEQNKKEIDIEFKLLYKFDNSIFNINYLSYNENFQFLIVQTENKYYYISLIDFDNNINILKENKNIQINELNINSNSILSIQKFNQEKVICFLTENNTFEIYNLLDLNKPTLQIDLNNKKYLLDEKSEIIACYLYKKLLFIIIKKDKKYFINVINYFLITQNNKENLFSNKIWCNIDYNLLDDLIIINEDINMDIISSIFDNYHPDSVFIILTNNNLKLISPKIGNNLINTLGKYLNSNFNYENLRKIELLNNGLNNEIFDSLNIMFNELDKKYYLLLELIWNFSNETNLKLEKYIENLNSDIKEWNLEFIIQYLVINLYNKRNEFNSYNFKLLLNIYQKIAKSKNTFYSEFVQNNFEILYKGYLLENKIEKENIKFDKNNNLSMTLIPLNTSENEINDDINDIDKNIFNNIPKNKISNIKNRKYNSIVFTVINSKYKIISSFEKILFFSILKNQFNKEKIKSNTKFIDYQMEFMQNNLLNCDSPLISLKLLIINILFDDEITITRTAIEEITLFKLKTFKNIDEINNLILFLMNLLKLNENIGKKTDTIYINLLSFLNINIENNEKEKKDNFDIFDFCKRFLISFSLNIWYKGNSLYLDNKCQTLNSILIIIIIYYFNKIKLDDIEKENLKILNIFTNLISETSLYKNINFTKYIDNILKDTNKNNYSYQNHTFQFFEDFYNTLKNNKEKLEQNKITIEDLIYNSNANLVNLKKLEKLFDIQKDK